MGDRSVNTIKTRTMVEKKPGLQDILRKLAVARTYTLIKYSVTVAVMVETEYPGVPERRTSTNSETKSHHAVSLLQHIKRVAVSRREYLPRQI
jgi:hypothetical protein